MITPRVIQPVRTWALPDLREIWRFRVLLWFLTLREIKAQYRQTALGPLWFVIKPFVTMVIFSLIFGRLAQLPSEGVPYPLFTYSALIPWTYFAGSTAMSVSSLVKRMQIISKVYFPRLIVPFAAVLTNLVDLIFSFVILLAMMFLYGYGLRWEMLLLPFYVVFAATIAMAIGLLSATLAVKYRDMAIGVGFALTIWMYLTPVAYSASLIPEEWRTLYELNPMFWVVEGFRWALLDIGTPPQPFMLVPLVAVLALFFGGLLVFHRTEGNIVDLL